MVKRIGVTGCLIYAAILGALAYVAGLLFEYSLWILVGKDVPFWADMLGGVTLNGINVPVAVICLVLRLSGVETPVFSV